MRVEVEDVVRCIWGEDACSLYSGLFLGEGGCCIGNWRRKWQPTPLFLPGKSQGWGSLVGCRLLGRTESDMAEAT